MSKPIENPGAISPDDLRSTDPSGKIADELQPRVDTAGMEGNAGHDDIASPVVLGGDDDLIASLTSAMPVGTNIDLILDHLTTSSDLFEVPHLDFFGMGAGASDDSG